jgi:hypothetical protein
MSQRVREVMTSVRAAIEPSLSIVEASRGKKQDEQGLSL